MNDSQDMPNPLSFAQQRIWFFNQLEPESPLYSGAIPTRWLGPLDLGALEHSLAELVRRHEVLRTRFPLTTDGVAQEVGPAETFHLPVHDCSGLPGLAPQFRARGWILEAATRPFDLTRESPMRAGLLRLAPEDHVLVLVLHHIAFDRWSRGLLRRELATLYTAFVAGRPSPLPELAVQYRDYARDQRDQIRSGALAPHLAYWREQLSGAPAAMDLPTDRPRGRVRSYRGEELSSTLSPGLVEALGALSRRERVTLFMTLLSGFSSLLCRWTGQTDIVIGSPSAGRSLPELETLIGCFTNTLVLRVDLSGNPTFRQLLAKVRAVAIGAYAHQFPFEKLVEELQPERDTRHHPMFQVLFNYLDFAHHEATLPGLRGEDWQVDLETALVDLSVDIRKAPEGLTCYFTYSTELFERTTVARLMSHYVMLLEAAVRAPDRALSALALPPWESDLDETERLLQELNQLSEEEAERLLDTQLRDLAK